MVEEPAPAKINLFLHVVGRRPDGYHEIETLFAFLAFGDRVRVQRAPAWSVTVSGPFADGVPCNDENLALRAARVFMARQAQPFAVSIEIDKQIPHAAGLGGGSADAGAVLRALNRLAESPLMQDDLLDVARSLGADVPACVRSHMCFATGVGDRLGPTLVPPDWPLLLCKPDIQLSTKAVFQNYAALTQPFSEPLSDLTDVTACNTLAARTSNDLTRAAIALAPELQALDQTLTRLPGARFIRMSGSGPTYFALGPDSAVVQAWSTASALPPSSWKIVTKLENLRA